MLGRTWYKGKNVHKSGLNMNKNHTQKCSERNLIVDEKCLLIIKFQMLNKKAWS